MKQRISLFHGVFLLFSCVFNKDWKYLPVVFGSINFLTIQFQSFCSQPEGMHLIGFADF